jgi:tRNA pseudouridine55 synthase
MHGVLNILKPPGPTSHDIVAQARRALKTKRVGHTGTLDPAATGVLPICVGHATRLVEYLQATRKTYIAEATFGFETDTLDAVGQVTARSDASHVDEAALNAALHQFRGNILQVPPMFSALKREGKSLHELARAGEVVEIEARPTEIFALELKYLQRNESGVRAMIEIECAPGTYIRSLVRDIGHALGTHATMSFLVRTASGRFGIADATPPTEIEATKMVPLLDALRWCAVREVRSDALAQKLARGQKINMDAGEVSGEAHQRVLILDSSGEISALAAPDEASASARNGGLFRAEKVFLGGDALA